MKIVIRKTDSGYEIEASDEEILSLFQKFLNELNMKSEEEAKKMLEETSVRVQDILSQIGLSDQE